MRSNLPREGGRLVDIVTNAVNGSKGEEGVCLRTEVTRCISLPDSIHEGMPRHGASEAALESHEERPRPEGARLSRLIQRLLVASLQTRFFLYDSGAALACPGYFLTTDSPGRIKTHRPAD